MRNHISLQHQAGTPYITLNTGHCKACWACVDVCPQHVFGKVDFLFHRHARIDQAENCQGCLLCLDACPHQAILSIEKTHDNISG